MIKLTDEWAITADEFQYILGRPVKRIRKDGRSSIEMHDVSYHRCLETAAERFIKQQHRSWVKENETDLKGAVEALQGITDELFASARRAKRPLT